MGIPRIFSRLVLAGVNPNHLQGKTVAVMGCGGIGCVVAEMLVRVGVGRLILVDRDLVAPENLNRLGFTPEQIGRPKAEALAEFLRSFNAVREHLSVDVEAHFADVLFWDRLEDVVSRSDLIITSFDNLDARLRVNEVCVRLGKPLIDCGTSLDGWSGRVNVIIPGKTPCLACYYDPRIIVGENSSWVAPCGASLPTTMTIVASLAVDQALRILLGMRGVVPRIIVSLRGGINVRVLEARRRRNCPVCGATNER